MNKVAILATAAGLAVVALLSFGLDAAQARRCNNVQDPDGSYSGRSCTGTGPLVEFECRFTAGSGNANCVQCGACHTGTPPPEESFALPQHNAVFQRSQLSLAPGRKLSWNPGTYLMRKGGRICQIDKKDQEILCYPSGAMILQNPQGQPFAVFSPTPAVLTPVKKP